MYFHIHHQRSNDYFVTHVTGSGKSTVISLLQRFYDPIEGQIFLDGHNIQNLNLKWLRNATSLVAQEPVLFNASVLENI